MSLPSIQDCDNLKTLILLLLQKMNENIIYYIPEKVFEAEKEKVIFKKCHKHRKHMDIVCDFCTA